MLGRKLNDGHFWYPLANAKAFPHNYVGKIPSDSRRESAWIMWRKLFGEKLKLIFLKKCFKNFNLKIVIIKKNSRI